ncbi:MAG: hypothetical protein PVJ92_02265, partial [Candidatus Dependentiae bacterium]
FHDFDCAEHPQGDIPLFIKNLFFTLKHHPAYDTLEWSDTGSVYLSSVDKLSREDQEAIASLMVQSLRQGGPRFLLSSKTLSLHDMDEEKLHPSFLLHLLQYPLELPPLHKRAEDIPTLLEFYAQKNGATLNLSDAELKELQTKKWSENIRELRKLLQKK